MSLRNGISLILWRMGISEFIRRARGQNSRFVLMFHGIASRPHPNILKSVQPSLSQADLNAVLSWLRSRYPFLTPNEFLDTDKPGVLLTFDDGLANNHVNALPVLQEFNAPAIFFVSTQHMIDPQNWLPATRQLARKGWGKEEYVPEEIAQDFYTGMSAGQLAECADHPLITIGSHTISHPFLTRCEPHELERELVGSKQVLEKITVRKIDLFAYPTGDYDAKVAEAVRDAGYRAAFAVDALNIAPPLLEIPRVGIYTSDAPYLSWKLSGLHRHPLRAGRYLQHE